MIQQQRGKDSVLFASTSATAVSSATFDTTGADYATIRIAFSSEVNTDAIGPLISLADSATSGGTYVTVVADRTTEDLTAARALTYHVDMHGKQKFLKLTITPETVATQDKFVVSAIGTLSRQIEGPAATTDMADAAVIVV